MKFLDFSSCFSFKSLPPFTKWGQTLEGKKLLKEAKKENGIELLRLKVLPCTLTCSIYSIEIQGISFTLSKSKGRWFVGSLPLDSSEWNWSYANDTGHKQIKLLTYPYIRWRDWSRGNKRIFMLNSAEHEFFSSSQMLKCQQLLAF